VPQLETEETETWSFQGDENATFENFVVIAALFDKSSGVERYVVQTATTEQANIQISKPQWDPEYPAASDDLTVWADVTGTFEEVELEYAICTADMCLATEYSIMELQDGDTYITTIGGFPSDAESIHFSVIARDAAGNEVKTQLEEIYFGQGGSGGDGDDEPFLQDPSKMGWVGLGVLLFVPLAVYFLDKRKEDGEEWETEVDHDEDYVTEDGYHQMEYEGYSHDENDDYDAWEEMME